MSGWKLSSTEKEVSEVEESGQEKGYCEEKEEQD